MSKRRHWLGLPALTLVLAAMLGGCNTVEGIGEDLAAAGNFIANSADDSEE